MAPGLPEAREKLNLDKLSKSELEAYYRHLDNVVILRDNINTECAEGRAEGRAEEKREMALRMKSEGIPTEVIARCSGLQIEDIENL